jgi:hypothetical protein
MLVGNRNKPLRKENEMDAMQYWTKYGREPVMKLCETCGTTYAYWKHIANKRKRPSVDLARRFVDASNGEMSLDALLPPKREMRIGKQGS